MKYPDSVIVMTTVEWQHADAAKWYVPLSSSTQTEGASTSGANVSIPMPYAGRLVRITVNQNSGTVAGATTLELEKGTGGAHPDTALESKSVTIASLDTSYQADFTDASRWAEGDRLAISFDPTANIASGYVVLTIIMALEVPQI